MPNFFSTMAMGLSGEESLQENSTDKGGYPQPISGIIIRQKQADQNKSSGKKPLTYDQ